MARFSGAEWTPITRPHYNDGLNRPVAIVFHRTAGTNSHPWLLQGGEYIVQSDGTVEDRRVSVHFLVRRDGHIYQYRDTTDGSWGQGRLNFSEHTPDWLRQRARAGESPNNFVISVENEANGIGGDHDQPLTAEQIDADSRIALWACQAHGIPVDRAHFLVHYQIDILRRAYCPWGYAGALYPFGDVIEAVREGLTPDPGLYRTLTELNIRRDPSTTQDRVGVLQSGELFQVDSVVRGEVVVGNAWWLHLSNGSGFVSDLHAQPASLFLP